MNNEQGTRKLEVRSKFGGNLYRVPFEILTSLFMIQCSIGAGIIAKVFDASP